ELELEEAVPLIAPLLTEGDRQMMETAVWALGEIGGAEARRLLSSMLRYAEDTGDPDLLEMVEDAIASASLIGGGMVFDG
ncbi:MAG: HEAT repeat domain-containing protein, partial [Anaerolineae bacterium]|nr:HEAT repeat domain-containing protein [Anaerolineae bacterium]